jgi:biotin transport system substrate-specific component
MQTTAQSTLRMMMYAAMIAAVTIVMGLIPGIPLLMIPVPMVLQNMGVMMAGSILGGKYGTLSVGIFLLLACIGMPVLSGGRGGAVVFLGTTGGYLVAWLLAPWMISLIKHGLKSHVKNEWTAEFLAVWLGGVIFVALFGAVWLTVFFHLPLKTALLSSLLFVPGDTIKAIATVLVANRLKKIVHLN